VSRFFFQDYFTTKGPVSSMDVNQVPTRLFAAALATSEGAILTAKTKTIVRSIHWAAGSTASPTVTLNFTPKGGTKVALSGALQALTASSSGELLAGTGVPAYLVMEAGDAITGLGSNTGIILQISGDVTGGSNARL
jgi:hypothetical protein